MKKRVKLLTTIASLCLAVALMAFGVYAAGNTAMNLTSSVQFAVSDVFVSVTYTANGGGLNVNKTVKSYTESDDAAKVKTFTGLSDEVIGDAVFTTSDTQVIYTVTIKNEGSETIYVSLKDASSIADTTNLTYTAGTAVGTADAGVELGAGQTKNIEVKIVLNNFQNTVKKDTNVVTIKVAAALKDTDAKIA